MSSVIITNSSSLLGPIIPGQNTPSKGKCIHKRVEKFTQNFFDHWAYIDKSLAIVRYSLGSYSETLKDNAQMISGQLIEAIDVLHWVESVKAFIHLKGLPAFCRDLYENIRLKDAEGITFRCLNASAKISESFDDLLNIVDKITSLFYFAIAPLTIIFLLCHLFTTTGQALLHCYNIYSAKNFLKILPDNLDSGVSNEEKAHVIKKFVNQFFVLSTEERKILSAQKLKNISADDVLMRKKNQLIRQTNKHIAAELEAIAKEEITVETAEKIFHRMYLIKLEMKEKVFFNKHKLIGSVLSIVGLASLLAAALVICVTPGAIVLPMAFIAAGIIIKITGRILVKKHVLEISTHSNSINQLKKFLKIMPNELDTSVSGEERVKRIKKFASHFFILTEAERGSISKEKQDKLLRERKFYLIEQVGISFAEELEKIAKEEMTEDSVEKLFNCISRLRKEIEDNIAFHRNQIVGNSLTIAKYISLLVGLLMLIVIPGSAAIPMMIMAIGVAIGLAGLIATRWPKASSSPTEPLHTSFQRLPN